MNRNIKNQLSVDAAHSNIEPNSVIKCLNTFHLGAVILTMTI